MRKRVKALLGSMIALCLCTMLMIGATYSLFTGSATVKNHLQAGNLKVGLYKTKTVAWVLDEDTGLLAKEESPEGMKDDLTTIEGELFNLVGMIPTSYCELTVLVENQGSVAFEYGVSIHWGEDVNYDDFSDEQKAFASQIQITVMQGEKEMASFALSECTAEGNALVSLGTLTRKAEAEFTVKAEFVYEGTAQDVGLDFDLTVFATQVTTLS